MEDEPLFRDLAQVAREKAEAERERWDQRWDRLSAGQLSATEEAELRALAARSPEAAEAYEAFRPLGPEFQARVVGAIRAQSAEAAGESPKFPALVLSPPRDEPEPPATTSPRARVLRFPRLRSVLASAAAAAAAALFFAVRLPPALPAYAFDEPTGGSRALRSSDGEVGKLALRPGEHFEVIARPVAQPGPSGFRHRPPLEARSFLVTSGGDTPLPLEVHADVDSGGSVKLGGTVGNGFPPGPATLWTVVGYRGRLPTPAEIALLKGETQTRSWYAKPTPIEIRAP